ncbi:MAG: ADP-ribosylglycohydrolase family protein [Thermodesulfobacteriota bacterium]|nr:ADP-ribosylglycohydrolase family protein [Thermodesulfobacteriota bacterium]
MSLKQKFIGSLVGEGVGDSLGAGVEGFPHFFEVREPGARYTDDTHMMIGIAESLIKNKGFNGDDMAKTFIKHYEAEPWRGYGPGPPRIFALIKKGVSWDEAALKIYPGGSFGNGSAMRIAPVGIFYYNDQERLKDISYKSSKITHSHELGMEGAALQAMAVALAVGSEPPKLNRYEFLEKLNNFTSFDIYKKKLESIEILLEKKEERDRIIKDLGNDVLVFNSVPTAIYSFLANSDFKDAVTYAVGLGGDTDTIGAMTGAIAGAYYGIDAIPQEWKNKLENYEYIEKLAESLWKIKSM